MTLSDQLQLWVGSSQAFFLRRERACRAGPLKGIADSMGDSRVDGLRLQKACLDAALRATRQEMRRARQRQKSAKKSEESAWRLPAGVRHTVLIVFVLADYTKEPAIQFLKASARRRHWPEKSDEDLDNMVDELFLGADVHEVAAITDEDNPSDAPAMQAAAEYLQQWRVVAWTRQLNVQKGVAPSTDALLQKAEECRGKAPAAARPSSKGTSVEVRARMWARRLRLRWAGRLGRIRVREDLTVQQMREKAARNSELGLAELGFHFGCRTWPPILGTKLDPQLGYKL